MLVSQCSDYLYELRIALGNFPVSCFLVREKDEFTLIDTSLPDNGLSIVNAAESLGAPISRVAITHAHDDHVGSLDEIALILPEAEVIVSKREAKLLAGDYILLRGEPRSPLVGPYLKSDTKPSSLALPGDRIGSLEVICTKGHTPGHIAFFDHRDRSVIVGDALQTIGGLTVASVLNKEFPKVALATWDTELALQSAQVLADLTPALLATAHGPVIANPQAQMTKAIETAQRILYARLAA